MFRLIGVPNIDFIAKRNIAFLISGVLSGIGIVALVMLMFGKGNMGIDFAGGTMVQGYYDQAVSIDEVRSAVDKAGFSGATIQELTGREQASSFLVRVKETETVNGVSAAQRLIGALTTGFPSATFHKDSEHTIGPAVGESLRKDTFWAIVISVLAILTYIAIRFDFRGGVAATIATFHDVLIVLGVMYLLHVEMTLLLVTALLTLAGYSLTDTVVVYDRIRENLKKFRKKSDFVPTVNRSINETLSRTILTASTVLLVVIVLFFFGGEVLRDFSLAMILGVAVGTYSSIFVASTIMVVWEAKSPKRFK